ncbi:hypothetical protein CK501_13245 [Halovibrio salipaludis]|uniref:HipA-like C-terminal domain-containing protein n=1 Tax=Halovibrio salipaludis TaxID=2032626 RepID=A0A2A2F204_9GAMM|nr:HipA domain-containing protein [Halovibrio salipaludis]PAU78649.1 hypothetical protein CK501_13245 [Halovibrio salipaludis]
MSEYQSLTLQAFWADEWHDAADVVFSEPELGLLSNNIRISYRSGYVDKALDLRPLPAGEHLELFDERALSINLPASFLGDYIGSDVVAFLRDIIPQGAGRRHLARVLGYPENIEQSADIPLLREGCITPIGNLRIREAAESFQQRLETSEARGFSADEINNRADELIEHARYLHLAIGSASGVGGDAPKLMLTEAEDGLFYMEGTCSDSQAVRHWIIKFARGRRNQRDQDVLRGEAAVYQALAQTHIRSIEKAHLAEGEHGPALWLLRFDRRTGDSSRVQRLGMESIYSLMGMLGDGAALSHNQVARKLMERFRDDSMLVDYLLNDLINEAIGNRDNHGRNTAFLKDEGHFRMAPAFDLAPMVLDPEGISRSSAWDGDWRAGPRGNYPAILDSLAMDAKSARHQMEQALNSARDLRNRLAGHGAPSAMLDHQGVRLELVDTVINELAGAPDAQS